MKFLPPCGDAVRLLGGFPSIGSPRYRHIVDIPGLRRIQTDRFPYLLFCREQGARLAQARLPHDSHDIASILKPG